MGQAQRLFDRAVTAYDKAISKIKMLDEVYQETREEMDRHFNGWDVRVTLTQFDRILQGILLSAALSDGDFHRLERQFIDKITDYGDLLIYIKKQTDGELDLSWDDIADLSPSVQRKLVDILPSLLDDCCDSFVGPLAKVDAAVRSHDFLDELVDLIAEIGACLEEVDGDSTRRESRAIADMAHKLLTDRWKRLL